MICRASGSLRLRREKTANLAVLLTTSANRQNSDLRKTHKDSIPKR